MVLPDLKTQKSMTEEIKKRILIVEDDKEIRNQFCSDRKQLT